MDNKLTFAFFIIFFFLFHFKSNAQSGNYFKGYIVTVSQDTIQGYIRDDSRRKIAQNVYFKRNENGQEEVFTPNEVKLFFYEPSFHFEAIKVNIENDEVKQFIRKLVNGTTDLYQIVTAKRQLEYVFVKGSGESIQIRKQDQVSTSQLKSDSKYNSLLKSFLKDCPDIALETSTK